MVQWLQIHLLMQRTWIWSLVPEDSSCRGQLNPCITTTELCSRACEPQLLKPACPRAHALQQRSHHNEKPTHSNWKLSPYSPQLEKACTAKNKHTHTHTNCNKWEQPRRREHQIYQQIRSYKGKVLLKKNKQESQKKVVRNYWCV